MEKFNYEKIKQSFKKIKETDGLDGNNKLTYNLIRTLYTTTLLIIVISIILGGGLFSYLFHICVTSRLAIPYILISIYIIYIFALRYVEFEGKKCKAIITSGILLTITFFVLFKAFSLNTKMDYMSRYVIPINSNVSKISDENIKKVIQNNIEDDVYVYFIEVKSDTALDNISYYSTMKYRYENKDLSIDIKGIFSHRYSWESTSEEPRLYLDELDGVKDLRGKDLIKIKALYLLGGVTYICLAVFTLNEFKRITIED